MVSIRTLGAALLLAGATTRVADAWWCTGHMIVAEIARRNLERDVTEKVTEAVRFMSQTGQFTQSPDMVQAACWADDIRKQGVTVMRGWHFIDQPVVRDGVTGPPVYNDNVVSEMTALDKSGHSWDVKKKPWAIGYVVMNYIHFFGDIHQPLHTADLFSSQFPQGDEGGNRFAVTFRGNRTNLHAVWDSVCGKFATWLPRPLSATDANTVRQAAEEIARRPVQDKRMYKSSEIAAESFRLAKDVAYGDLQPGATLSDSYITKCLDTAQNQLAAAGYRLAHELNYIFRRYRAAGPGDLVRHAHRRLAILRNETRGRTRLIRG